MSELDRQRGVVAAQEARTELYRTLSLLKDRLNYAQRIDRSIARAKKRVRLEMKENPLKVAGYVAGTVVGVAGIAAACVWAATRRR